jgi:hypothetical protein
MSAEEVGQLGAGNHQSRSSESCRNWSPTSWEIMAGVNRDNMPTRMSVS